MIDPRLTATVAGIEWNLTAKCEVQCDVCRHVYKTQAWKFPPAKERALLAEQLREAGWLVEGDHERHVCPDCNRPMMTDSDGSNG